MQDLKKSKRMGGGVIRLEDRITRDVQRERKNKRQNARKREREKENQLKKINIEKYLPLQNVKVSAS